jgi:flagellin-like hook-associated protein FlgL
MRLRLSKKTQKKLPFKDDQVPLKTKENLEEHLQSAISFLQTQQNVLERTVEILEGILEIVPTMKADVIRSVSEEEEKESRSKFKSMCQELKWLASLEFNQRSLFSQEGKDLAFKLFKDAGPSAPLIKHAAPQYLQSLEEADNDLSDKIVQKCLQALQEMLGQTDATKSDLQTSFKALASEPDAQKKLKFLEDRVKTWVSEVIDGQDGISVQANLMTKRVDGLVQGLQGLIKE